MPSPHFGDLDFRHCEVKEGDARTRQIKIDEGQPGKGVEVRKAWHVWIWAARSER